MSEEEIREMVDRVFDLRFYIRTWGPMWWDEWHRQLPQGPARTELQRLIFRGNSTDFGATHRKPGFLRWRRVLKCALKHPELNALVDESWRSFQRVEMRTFRALEGKRSPEKLQDEGRLLEENVRRVLTGFGRVDETNPDFTLSHSGDGILMVEVHSASGLKKELAFGIQNILHGLKNLWCVVLKPQSSPPVSEGTLTSRSMPTESRSSGTSSTCASNRELSSSGEVLGFARIMRQSQSGERQNLMAWAKSLGLLSETS